MRHFIYFENGGPFPGTCISCGATKELYDVGGTRFDGGNNLLCKRCIGELAVFTGYVPEAPLAELIELKEEEIGLLNDQLNRIPGEVEELINGIRSRVTDFVFAVSYSDSASDSSDDKKPKLSIVPDDQHSTAAKRGRPAHHEPTSK